MYKVGVMVWGGVADWFCVHESVEYCLATPRTDTIDTEFDEEIMRL